MLHDCALIKYPIMIRRHFAFKKRSTIFDLSVNYWKFFFPPAHPDSLFLSRKHFRRALFALLCTRARKLDTISLKRGGGETLLPPSYSFIRRFPYFLFDALENPPGIGLCQTTCRNTKALFAHVLHSHDIS